MMPGGRLLPRADHGYTDLHRPAGGRARTRQHRTSLRPDGQCPPCQEGTQAPLWLRMQSKLLNPDHQMFRKQ